MKEVIAIACDHGGFTLKEELKQHLTDTGYEVLDLGTDSTASVDYPVYAHLLCTAIQEGKCRRGILICGTGIGMSIAANKHKGIRAACCGDTFSARFTAMHNDTNVLCLGARVLGAGLAIDIADTYLQASYEGGRHDKRLAMIAEFEN